MNYPLLPLLILSFLYTGSCLVGHAQNQSSGYVSAENGWQIDGKADEWLEATVQDPKSGWYYVAGLDEAYLYVGVAIPAQRDQDLIGLTGLTLKWGKKPKKDRGYGLEYPIGLTLPYRPSNPQELDAVIFEGAIDLWAVVSDTIMVSRIDGKQTADIGSWQRQGVDAEIGRTVDGIWVYEAKIPLALVYPSTSDPNKIQLILETGSLGRPDNLRGTDAVGISGGSVSNPRQLGTRDDQARQSTFDRYASFTSPIRLHIKQVRLPQPVPPKDEGTDRSQ